MPLPFSGRTPPRDAPLFQASPSRSPASTPTFANLASECRPLSAMGYLARFISAPDGRWPVRLWRSPSGPCSKSAMLLSGALWLPHPRGPSVLAARVAVAAGQCMLSRCVVAGSLVLTAVALGASGDSLGSPHGRPFRLPSLAVARLGDRPWHPHRRLGDGGYMGCVCRSRPPIRAPSMAPPPT